MDQRAVGRNEFLRHAKHRVTIQDVGLTRGTRHAARAKQPDCLNSRGTATVQGNTEAGRRPRLAGVGRLVVVSLSVLEQRWRCSPATLRHTAAFRTQHGEVSQQPEPLQKRGAKVLWNGAQAGHSRGGETSIVASLQGCEEYTTTRRRAACVFFVVVRSTVAHELYAAPPHLPGSRKESTCARSEGCTGPRGCHGGPKPICNPGCDLEADRLDTSGPSSARPECSRCEQRGCTNRSSFGPSFLPMETLPRQICFSRVTDLRALLTSRFRSQAQPRPLAVPRRLRQPDPARRPSSALPTVSVTRPRPSDSLLLPRRPGRRLWPSPARTPRSQRQLTAGKRPRRRVRGLVRAPSAVPFSLLVHQRAGTSLRSLPTRPSLNA